MTDFYHVLWLELLLLLIIIVIYFSFQLITLSEILIKNETYNAEIKKTSYAIILLLFFSIVIINILLFLVINKPKAGYYIIIIPFIIFAYLGRIFSFDKKVGYRIVLLNSSGMLSNYLENQKNIIDKLKLNKEEKLNEINLYIQHFENFRDYFQPIELIRIVLNVDKDIEKQYGILVKLKFNIKEKTKIYPIYKIKAIKMIIAARFPLEQFIELLLDIQKEIVNNNNSDEVNNHIDLLDIYCECIEMIATENIYQKKEKEEIVKNFFLIFNELVSCHDSLVSELVNSVCSHFNSIFPKIKEFIPTQDNGVFYQDGIDGMERFERKFFTKIEKKKYSDTMNRLIDEIKQRRTKI